MTEQTKYPMELDSQAAGYSDGYGLGQEKAEQIEERLDNFEYRMGFIAGYQDGFSEGGSFEKVTSDSLVALPDCTQKRFGDCTGAEQLAAAEYQMRKGLDLLQLGLKAEAG